MCLCRCVYTNSRHAASCLHWHGLRESPQRLGCAEECDELIPPDSPAQRKADIPGVFGATGDDTASLRIVSLQEVTNFKQVVLHRWFSLAADWVMLCHALHLLWLCKNSHPHGLPATHQRTAASHGQSMVAAVNTVVTLTGSIP